MNKYWLSGIIFLAYGMASPAFSSQTATLTINGRIVPQHAVWLWLMVNLNSIVVS